MKGRNLSEICRIFMITSIGLKRKRKKHDENISNSRLAFRGLKTGSYYRQLNKNNVHVNTKGMVCYLHVKPLLVSSLFMTLEPLWFRLGGVVTQVHTIASVLGLDLPPPGEVKSGHIISTARNQN